MRSADADTLVPVETQPTETLEGVLLELGLAARHVGVIHPDDEHAAVVTGEEPVEQCGSSVPDVE